MEARIVKALETAGRLTTRDLATRLGVDRENVYRCCKRLEEDGRLASELMRTGKKSVYFFPMTREVVSLENYERIEHLNEVITETVRAYSLPRERDQLVAALELRFEQFAARMAGTNKDALEEFAGELLEIVATAEKQGDITSHLGIRPMHPPVRVWTLGRQLSFI